MKEVSDPQSTCKGREIYIVKSNLSWIVRIKVRFNIWRDEDEVSVCKGVVTIVREGRIRKFVDRVDQISFSGEVAQQKFQNVLYITERGVFRLTADGLELIEIAPGISLHRDILNQMEFRPVVRDVRFMRMSTYGNKTGTRS